MIFRNMYVKFDFQTTCWNMIHLFIRKTILIFSIFLYYAFRRNEPNWLLKIKNKNFWHDPKKRIYFHINISMRFCSTEEYIAFERHPDCWEIILGYNEWIIIRKGSIPWLLCYQTNWNWNFITFYFSYSHTYLKRIIYTELFIMQLQISKLE